MSDRLAERIARELTAAALRPTDTLLVGFSGGRDSVALVELLLEAGFTRLCLLHLDHALRPDSAADADWAAAFGAKRGLETLVYREDVAALAKASDAGIEETGRAARFAVFGRVARERACPRVALAHHADDQVETFLFRLLRGSGSEGLGAMAPASERLEGDSRLQVLRPMLGIWRSEIDAYIAQRALPFREDPSNASPQWTRNRLRHELVPELERVMRRPVREAIWRAAEVLRAESEWMDSLEAPAGPLPEKLPVAELRTLPVAQRRRRITRWLRQCGVSDVGFELVEAVAALAVQRFPAKLNLPGAGHVRRKNGVLFCEWPGASTADPPPQYMGDQSA